MVIRPYGKMKFNPDKCKRRSIRLKGWDYGSPGHYFVTICTHERECLFGDILNGEMLLNGAGRFVEQCWKGIPKHFPYADLDEFVIMPNHIHGILVIRGSVGANKHMPLISNRQNKGGANIYSPLQNDTPDGPTLRSPSKTVGSIVRGFKIGVGEWFRNNTNMSAIWQRNYYEHIIRNEAELNHIRQYIRDNPPKWVDDDENPKNQCGRGV